MTEPEPEQERHASWIELFFDLVAVAGVAQLTLLLHDHPTIGDVGLYALLFLAFWTVWATFTMYGNIARDAVRIPVMLFAMFGLAVMVACVASIPEHRANIFAVAYLVARLVAGNQWGRTEIVVDWPLAQLAGGVTPWIVSLWIEGPAKQWLWAAGLAIDLIAMFALTGDRMIASATERYERVLERRGAPAGLTVPPLHIARAEPHHLAERLGLFVIIMLGEGVIQLVSAMSNREWDVGVVATAIAGFVLLVGMWALALLHGVAGIPHLPLDALPPRIVMALHCFSTLAIATTGAGLGAAAAGHLDTANGWLLCGGLAGFFGVSLVAGLATGGARWRWILACALPCTVLPVVPALLVHHVPTAWVVLGLVAIVGWMLAYVRVLQPRADRSV